MTRTLTLDEARELVRADDAGKWDAVVPRHSLTMHGGCLDVPMDNADNCRLQLSRWATGQLCSRLGIPAAYFRTCPPHLMDAQVNYWLAADEEAAEEPWLLRAKGETLRAVLSKSYSPLDNATLLQQLHEMLDSRFRVDWFGLSEESLHLRVVDPKRSRELLPDDSLSVGIHLSNSEVGYRSVTVDALLYRLVCSNGLIRLVKGKSLLRRRHVHIGETRFAATLAEATENALTEAEGFLDRLGVTTRTPVPDPEEAIESLGKKWRLSQETQETVKQALRRERPRLQETLFGLVNAFTNAAQRLPDEDRYDLEVLAGHLAEHGVGSLKAFDARHEENGPAHGAESQGVAANGNAWSPLQLAQEMFDAQIVGRSAPGNAAKAGNAPKETVEVAR